MAYILALGALLATLLGGLFALKKRDKLHLILGFSAGAVIGVAFFDLMPEALDLATKKFAMSTATAIIACGFILFMLMSRLFLLHPHTQEDEELNNPRDQIGDVGAATLCIHSFLDGVGIGLAFKVSPAVGLIVAAAVLAHDFSDGINTVSFILKHSGDSRKAYRWLVTDAVAPVLGVLATSFFVLPDAVLGLLLALFCGFFLYIGASDLLPESQHRHPKFATSLMTVLGVIVIFLAIHFASL